MLKSSLSGYSDAYIFVKGNITVVGQEPDKANNKQYLKTVLHVLTVK